MQQIDRPASKVFPLSLALSCLLTILALLAFMPKAAWAEEQEVIPQEGLAAVVEATQEDCILPTDAIVDEAPVACGETLAIDIESELNEQGIDAVALASDSYSVDVRETIYGETGSEGTIDTDTVTMTAAPSETYAIATDSETENIEIADGEEIPLESTTTQELPFDSKEDSSSKKEDSNSEEAISATAIITYRSGIGGSVRADAKDVSDSDWSSEVSSFYTSNTRKDVVGAVARATKGFKFDGWVDTATGITVSKDAHLIPTFPAGGWPEVTTYLATFSPVEFLLVLDPGEGNGAGFEQTQTYGVDVTLPVIDGTNRPIAQRRGYAFEGWAPANRTDMTIADGGVLSAAAQRSLFAGGVFATSGKLSLSLRALWRELPVTIAYVASKGGTVSLLDSSDSNNTISEIVGSATGIPTGAIAKAQRGYHFVGWNDTDGKSIAANATLSGTAVAAACKSDDDDTEATLVDSTFTAIFNANSYKILYASHLGNATSDVSGATTETLTYGTTSQVPTSHELFTREGYTASGWSTTSDDIGTTIADGGIITTDVIESLIENGELRDEDGASLTLFPVWQAIKVTPPNHVLEPQAPAIKPTVADVVAVPAIVPENVFEPVAEIVEKTPEVVEDVVEEIEGVSPLQVSVPSTPIVTRDVDAGTIESGIASLLDMTPTQAARVVGSTVTTVAGVGAVAALLSAGASIMGAVAGVGGAATVGVTGVASAGDIAAELAADRNAEGKPGIFARFRQWLKKKRDQILMAQEILG